MVRKEDTPLRINTPKPNHKGIYIVTNRLNGKQFVGMDNNMPLQFYQHVKGTAKCQMLHEALSDTGLENWSVQFVPYPGLSLKDLQAIKRWHICKLRTEHPNGYNTPLRSNGNPEQSENLLKLLNNADLKAQVRERRRKSGALLETIAAEFGLSSATVGRWCRDIKDAKAVRDYPLRTQARERRRAGATLQAIAAEFGISISKASRWCQGIKVPKVLSPTETEIIGLLADGQLWTPSNIQQHSKVTRQAVMSALKSLLENGLITKVKKGCYQKAGEGA
jgi:transcriptional regulator with XRE-family HTH domain